jgi:hypothetical protein
MIQSLIHSFIHSVVQLPTVPQPLPNRVLHTARSSASSFNLQCPVFPLRSSTNCLRLLPRFPLTSILPSIFPSITCFRRQFLRKMWPTQLAYLLFIVRKDLPFLLDPFKYHFILHTIGPSTASHFKTLQALILYFPKCPSFSTIQSYDPNLSLYSFLPYI